MSLKTLILAAGKGTRMKSDLPKVIHKVCGVPMVKKIADICSTIGSENNILILGHKKEEILKVLEDVEHVVQLEQLGTGHAVMQAQEKLKDHKGTVMVLCGDTPLLTRETLENLYKEHKKSGAVTTILTSIYENPFGYGRIVKENDNVKAIIEEKDATEEERKIQEVNAGVYCFETQELLEALSKITNNNKNGEYYLTDVVGINVSQGKKVKTYILEDNNEILGINSKVELEKANRIMRERINKYHMENGVIIIDQNNTYIEETVTIGKDTVLYPGVFLQGDTSIGENCEILGNTRIIDCKLGNNIRVESSVLEESIVEDKVTIGPFAHLRPKSYLKEEVHIGNFVEVKKSTLEKGVKAGHLTYLGDAVVGEHTNIGAGTITCNYDGKNKFKTEIGKNSFIGSDTMLVAPVVIGDNALVGAGSVITKEVPENALAVSRSKQVIKFNWRK
ncbi:bifunctional UDP-N-acetylglucosamine diphosphorylase/glucosamine-1-phosphate N-acetyltransferase GlmU [uncultured Cetobacterium sp.]|uniref:bifunctional UDP-N-acetylglucosamine diphosphorylase/glucosamine-1-phosphate N-acetyltransferase GlmU n=1 Tax=uncultured Cetobacterium sp. TaxID=527638 RepID=UPI0026229652|nr:bifunctional UDP-N-acetylglucosamine diphosphorylase/glucosamine-1-phosphate N-acetyltransferase GlmU [uncultured Cetobacterium sp.]